MCGGGGLVAPLANEPSIVGLRANHQMSPCFERHKLMWEAKVRILPITGGCGLVKSCRRCLFAYACGQTSNLWPKGKPSIVTFDLSGTRWHGKQRGEGASASRSMGPTLSLSFVVCFVGRCCCCCGCLLLLFLFCFFVLLFGVCCWFVRLSVWVLCVCGCLFCWVLFLLCVCVCVFVCVLFGFVCFVVCFVCVVCFCFSSERYIPPVYIFIGCTLDTVP